jgi:raffinose/stachyose/melibiose transport system permease protein
MASVMFATIPLITLLIASLVGLEKLTWLGVLGAAIVIAGISLVFLEQLQFDVSIAHLGATLLAAVSASLSGIVVKYFPRSHPVATNAGLEDFTRIWLGDPQTALLAISVVSGWVYAGFYMVIFYAAFRQIDDEIVEAARLDGAGEWALFRRVKVPMIRGATGVAILLCVTGGFQGFDLFFVLTNGGPYGSTEIPTTLLVKTVFRNADVGYGSAMAVLLTGLVVGIGLIYMRGQGRGLRRRRTAEATDG